MKRAFYFLSALSVIALVLAFSLLSPVEGQEKTIVRNYGAGLLSDVVQTHREEFVRADPAPKLTIIGPTTRIGDQKPVDREAELGIPTQRVPSEAAKMAIAKGAPLTSTFARNVCLAVITNEKDPVNEITMYQPAQVFQVSILNWSSVGGLNEHITVTIQALPETGVGVLFQREVLKGAPYAKDAQIVSSYNATVQVSSISLAMGYIPPRTLTYDYPAERGVQTIKINKGANSEPYEIASGVARPPAEPFHPTGVDVRLLLRP